MSTFICGCFRIVIVKGWVVLTETVWSAKRKLSATWTFTETVCPLLLPGMSGVALTLKRNTSRLAFLFCFCKVSPRSEEAEMEELLWVRSSGGSSWKGEELAGFWDLLGKALGRKGEGNMCFPDRVSCQLFVLRVESDTGQYTLNLLGIKRSYRNGNRF